MSYLLAIDVGNTQTSIGVFEENKLFEHWRVSTNKEETADEIGLTVLNLFKMKDIKAKEIDGVVISSVVPHCTISLNEMVQKYFSLVPLIVNPGIKTGISILYDNPREIGADRIANATAALKLYGAPIIIVDFGTATTFDVISSKGDYIGGIITPGVEISAEALFEQAAKLARVELVAPEKYIGKNTKSSLQAGIIFGTVGMVDYLVNQISKELRKKPKVIATGGLGELIISYSDTIEEYNQDLTLIGLKIIYKKNLKS
ncbi:MAG: type III pantothenate kinase [Actinomycetia bacterium]|nr:type III pantothenate kinase [Actinomycetes bacterium]